MKSLYITKFDRNISRVERNPDYRSIL